MKFLAHLSGIPNTKFIQVGGIEVVQKYSERSHELNDRETKVELKALAYETDGLEFVCYELLPGQNPRTILEKHNQKYDSILSLSEIMRFNELQNIPKEERSSQNRHIDAARMWVGDRIYIPLSKGRIPERWELRQRIPAPKPPTHFSPPKEAPEQKEITRLTSVMREFAEAYPEQFDGKLYKAGSNYYLRMTNEERTRILLEDGKKKSFAENLYFDGEGNMLEPSEVAWHQHPDLASQLEDPLEGDASDLGRVKNELLFASMYGNTEAEVQKHLVEVPLPYGLDGTLKFTSVNEANKQLEAVFKEIETTIPKSRGEAYFEGIQDRGTLIPREDDVPVTSTYESAIGIDLNFTSLMDKKDLYWVWNQEDFAGQKEYEPLSYAPKIPADVRVIAGIFKKHGFISGGDWNHYDLIHFEYRPELISDDSSESEISDRKNLN